MDLGLKGKRVLVAGASSGLGLAAAEEFGREGARVAMFARDEAKLQGAADKVRAAGADAVIAAALDATDGAAVAALVERMAAEWGGVDVCVANAGGPPPGGFLGTDDAGWDRAMQLNLLSVVRMARAVLPHMKKSGWGRIVTITSVAVRQPVPELVYSNTVRAGVVGLVKSLSNEFGRDGVTVNNVAPGYARTDRLLSLAKGRAEKAGGSVEAALERMGAETALERVGEPREVADAIVWLCSERASYVTGQTLLVDGGAYRGV